MADIFPHVVVYPMGVINLFYIAAFRSPSLMERKYE
jgi:hypothetical protein